MLGSVRESASASLSWEDDTLLTGYSSMPIDTFWFRKKEAPSSSLEGAGAGTDAGARVIPALSVFGTEAHNTHLWMQC